jgi:hypothetical protein
MSKSLREGVQALEYPILISGHLVGTLSGDQMPLAPNVVNKSVGAHTSGQISYRSGGSDASWHP